MATASLRAEGVELLGGWAALSTLDAAQSVKGVAWHMRCPAAYGMTELTSTTLELQSWVWLCSSPLTAKASGPPWQADGVERRGGDVEVDLVTAALSGKGIA